MSRFALSIALGPVQRFIAAGRRSRDLWWGSSWLSECTLAGAFALLDTSGVKLMLPDEEHARELLEKGPRARYGDRIANHLRVIVEGDPVRVATTARGAARTWLVKQLDEAKRLARERVGQDAWDALIDATAWEAQRLAILEGDFLDFYAAWVPVQGREDDADHEALNRADGQQADRKQTRTFAKAPSQPGRVKSDLDAGWDSIFAWKEGDGPPPRRALRARARLGIGPAERLDIVSFARRISAFSEEVNPLPGGPCLGILPFPPVGRIAVDPWLRGAPDERLRDVARLLWEAENDHLFYAWCSPCVDPDGEPGDRPHHRFPFDVSVLLEGGLPALQALLERYSGRPERSSSDPQDEADVQVALGRLHSLRRLVEDLHRTAGFPEPYYAVLAMDGDGLGTALRKAPVALYRDLVKALDGYADEVAEVVKRHHGRAFYAGGDDLLAFLPLDTLLDTLLEIDELWTACFKAFNLPEISISAGVALVHIKDDLRAARQSANDALADAKRARAKARNDPREEVKALGDKGWLSIREIPRSGVERKVTRPLAELVGDLELWVIALRDEQISLRTPELLHELEQVLDRKDDAAVLLVRDRLRAQSLRSSKDKINNIEYHINKLQIWADVASLTETLRVASRLRASCVQSGRWPNGDEGSAS